MEASVIRGAARCGAVVWSTARTDACHRGLGRRPHRTTLGLLLVGGLLAGARQRLLVLGVRALDRLLQLGQRRWDRRAAELAQRLGGVVLVRGPPGRGRALAAVDDQAAGMLLGGDDDQRPSVELGGRLGAV